MQIAFVDGGFHSVFFFIGQGERMFGPGAPAFFQCVGGINAQPQSFRNIRIVADAGGKIDRVPIGAKGRVVQTNHNFLFGTVHNGARLKLLVGGKFQIASRQKYHGYCGIAQTLGNAHIGRIAACGAAPHTEALVIHFYGNGISYFFVLLCVGNKHKGRFSLIFGDRRKCHDQKHLCNTNYNYYII